MPIVLELSDEELHNLANWVQVEMWRIEAGQEKRHGMLVIGERVLAAANQPRRATNEAEQSAFEYVGKYFAMKARAEHLEVQNTLLMKAVEQMAQRGSVMQSALIEAGLAKLIPPPVRLF